MKRAVILSFTAALDYVAAGTLTEEQLKEAIFCLGCAKMWPDQALDIILERHCPYQHETISQKNLDLFRANLRAAEEDNRVVWRWDMPTKDVHNALSVIFTRLKLQPLNYNLPAVGNNKFLKMAIERVNNKDGREAVWVIDEYDGLGGH